MNELDFQEQAQLGLKYIEDSVVNLLTRHPRGLSGADIATSLGLGAELPKAHRERFVASFLELLVASGRISQDPGSQLFIDNPERS
ncbi:MAG: hypothetical protein ACTHLT_13395 [Devosia sp.]